jgi:hypothetical protein
VSRPAGGVTDADEIRALLQRYARAADDRDIESLASIFHPEARIAGARGEQSLGEWLESMRAPRAFPVSMHMLGDPLLEFDRRDAARADTYAVVFQIGDPSSGGADLTLGIRYLDHLVRHEGRWVVLRRAATTVWTR